MKNVPNWYLCTVSYTFIWFEEKKIKQCQNCVQKYKSFIILLKNNNNAINVISADIAFLVCNKSLKNYFGYTYFFIIFTLKNFFFNQIRVHIARKLIRNIIMKILTYHHIILIIKIVFFYKYFVNNNSTEELYVFT